MSTNSQKRIKEEWRLQKNALYHIMARRNKQNTEKHTGNRIMKLTEDIEKNKN